MPFSVFMFPPSLFISNFFHRSFSRFPFPFTLIFFTYLFFSLYRLVREQASRALKNICTNVDKPTVYTALSQITESKGKLSEKISTQQCESLSDLSDTSVTSLFGASPSSVDVTWKTTTMPSRDVRTESMSKVERTMAEITSVLALSCKSDSLIVHGISKVLPRQSSLSTARSEAPFSENYLGSLRVLTNVVSALRNVVSIEDGGRESRNELSMDAPRLVGLLNMDGGNLTGRQAGMNYRTRQCIKNNIEDIVVYFKSKITADRGTLRRTNGRSVGQKEWKKEGKTWLCKIIFG